MSFLKRAADNYNPSSYANTLRRKRFQYFLDLLADVPRPLRILDVGGTENYWASMGFGEESDIEIVLLNLTQVPVVMANCKSVSGDARDLSQFRDGEFEIVFSNSVIEHVGDLGEQQRMADEVQRVGQRYFVQTPNFYFPIEPHFLVPCFQFLPRAIQCWLAMNFNLGWSKKCGSRAEAEQLVDSVQLLKEREFKSMFPGAKVVEERVLGVAKSFTAVGGW